MQDTMCSSDDNVLEAVAKMKGDADFVPDIIKQDSGSNQASCYMRNTTWRKTTRKMPLNSAFRTGFCAIACAGVLSLIEAA